MGTRYSDARIESILREAASGVPVMDVCWNHCISRSTLRAWKAKYGAAIYLKERNDDRPHHRNA